MPSSAIAQMLDRAIETPIPMEVDNDWLIMDGFLNGKGGFIDVEQIETGRQLQQERKMVDDMQDADFTWHRSLPEDHQDVIKHLALSFLKAMNSTMSFSLLL